MYPIYAFYLFYHLCRAVCILASLVNSCAVATAQKANFGLDREYVPSFQKVRQLFQGIGWTLPVSYDVTLHAIWILCKIQNGCCCYLSECKSPREYKSLGGYEALFLTVQTEKRSNVIVGPRVGLSTDLLFLLVCPRMTNLTIFKMSDPCMEFVVFLFWAA